MSSSITLSQIDWASVKGLLGACGTVYGFKKSDKAIESGETDALYRPTSCGNVPSMSILAPSGYRPSG